MGEDSPPPQQLDEGRIMCLDFQTKVIGVEVQARKLIFIMARKLIFIRTGRKMPGTHRHRME